MKFLRQSSLPVPRDELFRWHERLGAFERLSPPWSRVQLVGAHSGIQNGARVTARVPFGPFHQEWTIEHRNYISKEQFQDVLIRGPFKKWEHLHRMMDDGGTASILEDAIEYQLPIPFLGERLAESFVQSELIRVFRYRHETTLNDLLLHRGVVPRRVAITGASGFVGSALVPFLTTGGHTVTRLVRTAPADATELRWGNNSDISPLNGYDAVIHLAGKGIATSRWTPMIKDAIAQSRIRGTKGLVEKLLALPEPPKVFISASAIGAYGNRGEELLTETSAYGHGFLADVARQWEEATQPLVKAGVRVVTLRFGVVLSPQGGALKRMLSPFRLGLGGPLGSGHQWMSWIALEDLIRIIYRSILDENLSGTVNAVAPKPIMNHEFAQTLGEVLRRPTPLRVPAAVLKLLFGEMATETLLASQQCIPEQLQKMGFIFLYPELEEALRFSLGKV